MSYEPAELKAHIKAEGESLRENIEEIQNRVKNALDWRIWYKNNTALALGSAAAGGLVVSLLLRRGGGPESEFIDSDEMMDESLMGPNRLRSEPRSVSRVHEVVDNTMSAVLGLAADKFQDFMSQALPGFRERYNEAQRRRS